MGIDWKKVAENTRKARADAARVDRERASRQRRLQSAARNKRLAKERIEASGGKTSNKSGKKKRKKCRNQIPPQFLMVNGETLAMC